jgi:hypothetical protein
MPVVVSILNLKRFVASSYALMANVAPPRYENASVLCGTAFVQLEPPQR